MSANRNENFVLLKNVRCSFPQLFGPVEKEGKTYNAGCTLLLDAANDPKHAQYAKDVGALIAKVIHEDLKDQRIPADRRCLRKGKDGTRPELDPFLTVSSNCKTKPVVLDKADPKKIITDQAACPIYAGCRVNAKIRLWGQNNKYGKRVNAELVAIQFFADDTPLDGTYIDPEKAVEGFEGFDTTDEDFGMGESDGVGEIDSYMDAGPDEGDIDYLS